MIHHVVRVVEHRDVGEPCLRRDLGEPCLRSDLGEPCLRSRTVCNLDVCFQAVRISAVVTFVTYAVEVYLYLLSSLQIYLLVNISFFLKY